MSSASPRTATCGSAAATKAFGSPTTGVIEWTEDGIPYGRPEIVLLFKAKHAHRDRDQSDFEAVVPRLEQSAGAGSRRRSSKFIRAILGSIG